MLGAGGLGAYRQLIPQAWRVRGSARRRSLSVRVYAGMFGASRGIIFCNSTEAVPLLLLHLSRQIARFRTFQFTATNILEASTARPMRVQFVNCELVRLIGDCRLDGAGVLRPE